MSRIDGDKQKDTYQKILTIKAELQELVQTFGILHKETVAKSQELDLIVNEYMISNHTN